jgi:uncharacterized protein YprB with RNaseH-like and TPR domain
VKKFIQPLDAYLDIETTGLSPDYGQITVIGIYLTVGSESWVTQLVGNEVTDLSLSKSLEGVDTIYTYNGSRFDLPFIYSSLKLDLESIANHHDLMYDCWQNNLYGGLKSVEQQLGIDRRLKHMNGYDAVRLWWKYVNDYDENALSTLLEYNREDVVNLSTLKNKLLYRRQ